MTLIIAVKCKDGLILGSDGAATLKAGDTPIKAKMRKIYKLNDRTLFAAAGTIGLIQKSLEVFKKHSNTLGESLTFEKLAVVRAELFPFLKEAKDRYTQYNYSKTEGVPLVDIVLCGYDEKGEPRIWHMAADTHDEFIDVVGCYATGIGAVVAYPLLRSLMPEKDKVDIAVIQVARIFNDSIKTCGMGISEPIDLWQVTSDAITHKVNEWIHEEI